jgi:hypothetical protein
LIPLRVDGIYALSFSLCYMNKFRDLQCVRRVNYPAIKDGASQFIDTLTRGMLEVEMPDTLLSCSHEVSSRFRFIVLRDASSFGFVIVAAQASAYNGFQKRSQIVRGRSEGIAVEQE